MIDLRAQLRDALHCARGFLAEAASLADRLPREDSALLAEQCDRLEQDVRAVQSAVEARP